MTCFFLIIPGVLVFAGLGYCVVAGFRNGDRAADARVSAVLAAQADGRVLAVATIRNPAGTAVLGAVRVRRAVLPGWLAEPHSVGVPLWTVRRTFQASEYACAGVVPADGAVKFPVPLPPAGPAAVVRDPGPRRDRHRDWVLTAVVGQEGGRLRLHRLRLAGPPAVPGRRHPVLDVR
jgi:hypothetical protein